MHTLCWVLSNATKRPIHAFKRISECISLQHSDSHWWIKSILSCIEFLVRFRKCSTIIGIHTMRWLSVHDRIDTINKCIEMGTKCETSMQETKNAFHKLWFTCWRKTRGKKHWRNNAWCGRTVAVHCIYSLRSNARVYRPPVIQLVFRFHFFAFSCILHAPEKIRRTPFTDSHQFHQLERLREKELKNVRERVWTGEIAWARFDVWIHGKMTHAIFERTVFVRSRGN